MYRTPSIAICVLALSALFIAGLMGCKRPAPLQFEVGFDVTPKDVEKRARQASQLANFVKKGDDFALRATDNKTSLISTVRPATDADAFRVLTSISGRIIPSTDLAEYFETAADLIEKSGKPLVIIIYTDGLSDDGDPDGVAARVTAAARRLARARRLRALIIAGTVRDVRPEWQGLPEMLAPVESKLFILPMATLDPGDIHRLVKNVRANVSSASQEGGN